MSIIEQAAKRLEELRRAGVEVPISVASVPVQAAARAVSQESAVEATPRRQTEATAPTARSEDAAGRRSRSVVINLGRLTAMGYVTPDTPRTQLAEEFRVIKRPLLSNAVGRSAAPVTRGNLIMVTSAMPGEGKTFTAVNLAMSIAMELDHTVLLVDADVARPAVLERLGLPATRGLLDLLTEPQIELADVLLRTNVEKLSILPAGAPHDRATELLSSDGMRRLLDELAGRYPDRIIVFDAPPLLASTESRALATQMGQVVVVVEAERTPQSAVEQALATIENCPVVMTLLNKVAASDVGSYYGYYRAVSA
ncbi:MAG TPA: XrtA-associated tyrosine autokinase [Burkholderiaceae bacterium]|nr:XrtA-associated tyrosine autokinase [Burkholderiaceae bacterium]